ncbi:MAG: hypothetical protein KDD46_03815 [Bdellovibrionales bacterium]|nr:hypothetical protein [Bdellovibrionales bacterium]
MAHDIYSPQTASEKIRHQYNLLIESGAITKEEAFPMFHALSIALGFDIAIGSHDNYTQVTDFVLKEPENFDENAMNTMIARMLTDEEPEYCLNNFYKFDHVIACYLRKINPALDYSSSKNKHVFQISTFYELRNCQSNPERIKKQDLCDHYSQYALWYRKHFIGSGKTVKDYNEFSDIVLFLYRS